MLFNIHSKEAERYRQKYKFKEFDKMSEKEKKNFEHYINLKIGETNSFKKKSDPKSNTRKISQKISYTKKGLIKKVKSFYTDTGEEVERSKKSKTPKQDKFHTVPKDNPVIKYDSEIHKKVKKPEIVQTVPTSKAATEPKKTQVNGDKKPERKKRSGGKTGKTRKSRHAEPISEFEKQVAMKLICNRVKVAEKYEFIKNKDFFKSPVLLSTRHMRGYKISSTGKTTPLPTKLYTSKIKKYRKYASKHSIKTNPLNVMRNKKGPLKEELIFQFKVRLNIINQLFTEKEFDSIVIEDLYKSIATEEEIEALSDQSAKEMIRKSIKDMTMHRIQLMFREYLYQVIEKSKHEYIGDPIKYKADSRGYFPRGGTGLLRQTAWNWLNEQYRIYISEQDWTVVSLSLAVPELEYAAYVNAMPTESVQHNMARGRRIVKYTASGDANLKSVTLNDPNAEEDFFHKAIEAIGVYAAEKLKILLNKITTRDVFVMQFQGCKSFKFEMGAS